MLPAVSNQPGRAGGGLCLDSLLLPIPLDMHASSIDRAVLPAVFHHGQGKHDASDLIDRCKLWLHVVMGSCVHTS